MNKLILTAAISALLTINIAMAQTENKVSTTPALKPAHTEASLNNEKAKTLRRNEKRKIQDEKIQVRRQEQDKKFEQHWQDKKANKHKNAEQKMAEQKVKHQQKVSERRKMQDAKLIEKRTLQDTKPTAK